MVVAGWEYRAVEPSSPLRKNGGTLEKNPPLDRARGGCYICHADIQTVEYRDAIVFVWGAGAVRTITRVKLCGERFFYSVGPMELFEKIEKYASIKKAAQMMEMSYTKALRIIRVAEEELGFPLVISEKGGNTRGQTRLTAKGKQVLTAFGEIQAEVSAFAEKLLQEKFSCLDEP